MDTQVNKVERKALVLFFTLALALVSSTVVMILSYQAANALTNEEIAALSPPLKTAYVDELKALIVNKAILLFGVNLPSGRESPTFIQNVTQLAKEGFDSPENAKLFLQLDSIALNASSSRPGNVTYSPRN